jgi:hypothetical protein
LIIGSSGDAINAVALQGVLVIQTDPSGTYERIPLMLTSDVSRAARLLRKLSESLDVPFVFHGDRAGWEREMVRAKSRPKLKSGGFQS